MGKIKTQILLLIVFLIIGAAAFGVIAWRDENIPTKDNGVDTSNWQEYRNEEFGFSLMHPQDWLVAAFPDDDIAPKFNVYPNTVSETPPFTHHNSVTQVSIFPQGVPTEGVFGETRESQEDLIEEADGTLEFILEDGTTWALIATEFSNAPASWQPWGFVWASIQIDDFTINCVRDEQVVDINECYPPATATFVRDGTVDQEVWSIIETILSSFEFVDTSTGSTDEAISYVNASDDIIVVDTPRPGDEISSPLVVRGKARGTWYFEATFPIVVVNWDGLIIGEWYAEAQNDPADDGASWMTEEFVPFEGTVEFTADTSVSNRGAVILQKSNPSGLPEHDAAVEIPIRFQK